MALAAARFGVVAFAAAALAFAAAVFVTVCSGFASAFVAGRSGGAAAAVSFWCLCLFFGVLRGSVVGLGKGRFCGFRWRIEQMCSWVCLGELHKVKIFSLI